MKILDRLPVLVTAYNRPDKVQLVLEQLSRIDFVDVFIAFDGPKNSGESVAVASAREVARKYIVDESRILYSEKNLGCRYAMTKAIDWFFEQVEFGVINEDDVIIDSTYFDAMRVMLPAYADSNEVFLINSFVTPRQGLAKPFFKGEFISSWGWATWRNRWSLYDDSLMCEAVTFKSLRARFPSVSNAIYFYLAFKLCKQGKMSSWAYRWVATVWSHDGISLTPTSSLSQSIGITPDATHTSKETHLLLKKDSINQDDLLNVCVVLGPDRLRDDRILSYISGSTNFIKLLRMMVSCCVPNPLFFRIRRQLR
ncbi:hypothetical protein QEH52_11900 [Coraliomargarita sp. SDUM461003]|uniref:Glycosyltransferase 2-like domain-containing protein n=1 Tax=Thalassobacterium maritimum TaxID=3041265 RepID=A0ABU1AVP0_9BACT|nr:hypothetical protein [Coraliomargarita sp. SDUM461003]MDQ8208216.1 hypothetical protein [Coraliomargarita sp. SDUM461003]